MNEKDDELIVWSARLVCGIKIIDEQHKGLIDLVNDMIRNATGNNVHEHEYFHKIVHDAVIYMRTHFATEEKIMLLTKFPGFAEHKKEHDNFILAIAEDIKDYEAEKKYTLSSFSRLVKDWLLSHISFFDSLYFEHLKLMVRTSNMGIIA